MTEPTTAKRAIPEEVEEKVYKQIRQWCYHVVLDAMELWEQQYPKLTAGQAFMQAVKQAEKEILNRK